MRVARKGQQLAGSTITQLALGDYSDEQNGLNDAGQVAYWAQPANGREVIALWRLPLDGDFNADGTVDAADNVLWRKTDSGNSQGYSDWRENFGEGMSAGGCSSGTSPSQTGVPEPARLVMLILAVAGWYARRRRGA